MKLKKVVSLAAAALMAVSMLTACGEGTGSTGSSSETPVVTVENAANKVIAQLSSDTTDKVTFTADATMQAALEDLIAQNGVDSTNVTAAKLYALNPKFADSATAGIYTLDTSNTETNDGKGYTYLFMVNTTSTSNAGDYAFAQLASQVEKTAVTQDTKVMSQLPDHGDDLGTTLSYYYDFDYTAKVAVAAAKNEATGAIQYYAAVAVTRTSTKCDK